MGKDPEELLKSLVRQASEGDRRAFGTIFRICYEDIYDYVIRRVGNRSDAEDITMKVFTKGLEAVANYEDRGYSVRAWLYRIAHNAVVDHYRVLKKDVELENIPELEDEARDVEKDLLYREDLSELYREIRKMSPAQAEVLILRFMEDMSVSETAMILDKKEVTVRALQFKGIKNLRKRIEQKRQEKEDSK